MEKENTEHKHRVEIIELEHKNELARIEQEFEASAKYNAIGDLFSNPEKMLDMLKLLENPNFQKHAKK